MPLSLRDVRGGTCVICSIAGACGRRRAGWRALHQQLNDFALHLLARTDRTATLNIKESEEVQSCGGMQASDPKGHHGGVVLPSMT